MKNRFVVLGACAFLGGCALPVPLQVASWAIDAISVIATEKSVTDHGISALTSKDCALHRVVTDDDGEVCREVDDVQGEAVIAAVESDSDTVTSNGPVTPVQSFAVPVDNRRGGATANPVTEVAHYETAAGSTTDRAEAAVEVAVDMSRFRRELEPEIRPYVRVQAVAIRGDARKTAGVDNVNDRKAEKPEPGFYYVIGSFRGHDRARQHMETYRRLSPTVLRARIKNDGRQVFRVVVGPVDGARKETTYFRIRTAGILDTWAIRVTDEDWTVAARPGDGQLAAVPGVLGADDWRGLGWFASRGGDSTHR